MPNKDHDLTTQLEDTTPNEPVQDSLVASLIHDQLCPGYDDYIDEEDAKKFNFPIE